MATDKSESAEVAGLRQRAGAALQSDGRDLPGTSPEELPRLVHELQTYQIELEMQNEELRTAEEDLSESRDRYSHLYDFAPVGYLTLSDKGLILQANLTAAEMLGVERSRLIKQRLSGFIVAEDEDVYYLHVHELLDTGGPRTCELRMHRSNDGPFWVRMQSTLAEAPTAGGREVLVVISGVTDRKRAEEALRKAHEELDTRVKERTAELAAANTELREEIDQRRQAEEREMKLQAELAHMGRLSTMGEMAGGLAHELNQPLTAIVLQAEAMLYDLQPDSKEDNQKLLQSLKSIAEQAHRSGDLIRRMRQFVKNVAPRRSTVTFNEIIREVVPLLEMDLREAGISLTVEIDQSLPHVFGDKIQLQQVVLNLVQNAIEAMQDTEIGERRLSVDVRPRDALDDLIEIAVRDTGCGIPADKVDRIDELFGTFYTTKPEGMGMGLGIARSIVESHGGHLWAEPNPDRGATFAFTLPIPAEAQTHDAEADGVRCR